MNLLTLRQNYYIQWLELEGVEGWEGWKERGREGGREESGGRGRVKRERGVGND